MGALGHQLCAEVSRVSTCSECVMPDVGHDPRHTLTSLFRLEQQTGQPLRDDLLSHLNVCLFTNKVRSGILAHGTSNQIKAEVREFLQQRGEASWNTQILPESHKHANAHDIKFYVQP